MARTDYKLKITVFIGAIYEYEYISTQHNETGDKSKSWAVQESQKSTISYF